MQKIAVKRNEFIKNLSKENHFNLLFSWKIKQGLHNETDIERICKYVHFFWQKLQRHFKEEEQIFFAPVNDKMVRRAIQEHRQIRSHIQSLENPSGKNAPKVLRELADIMYQHVQFEERDLFPHLERALNKNQLEIINNMINDQQPSTLVDNYKDQFWNIK